MQTALNNYRQAFTLVEVLVVLVLVAIGIIMLRPTFGHGHGHVDARRINCISNLRQQGISLRIWEGEHHDRYPMNVPVAAGGTRELMAEGNVAACFQVLSNELASPKLLWCPADSLSDCATNFENLRRSNVSYFIGTKIAETDPQAFLSGDDNLFVNARPIHPGILDLGTNIITWSRDRHQGIGHLLVADGSVQAYRHLNFTNIAGSIGATNMVVIP